MTGADLPTFDLLRLTLVPGLGPVLINRCLKSFGSAEHVLRANALALANVRGIGPDKARAIASAAAGTETLATKELDDAQRLGVRILSAFDPEYPDLLRQIPDPPPILYVRGRLAPNDADRYPVALVGSRSCTQYGREQADRFAAFLAESGLTIVSGGARGIDTAAHRAAIRSKGRTFAVLGCGLANVYPPDNAELFDQIAANDGHHGAVISELPLRTPPSSENFPARNRIISGLSLGVIVIEAGRRSGALITARAANEDHGREIFALPGRVDAPLSEGTLDLIKQGAAGLVTCPKDVIDALESRARHQFDGSHAAISSDPTREPGYLFEHPRESRRQATAVIPAAPLPSTLTDTQRAIIEALAEPCTMDELLRTTGLEASKVMAEVTMLEIKRFIVRTGPRLVRAAPSIAVPARG
jgi:DNA processing protein